jgi:hypothetical protein
MRAARLELDCLDPQLLRQQRLVLPNLYESLERAGEVCGAHLLVFTVSIWCLLGVWRNGREPLRTD